MRPFRGWGQPRPAPTTTLSGTARPPLASKSPRRHDRAIGQRRSAAFIQAPWKMTAKRLRLGLSAV